MLVGAVWTIASFYVQAVPGKVLVTPEIEIGWAMCTINCVLLTAGTFLLFTCIKRPKAPRIIVEMSKLSYGVYLIHIFLLGILYHLLSPYMGTGATIFIVGILTYAASYIVVRLLSCLPYGKYLVG